MIVDNDSKPLTMMTEVFRDHAISSLCLLAKQNMPRDWKVMNDSIEFGAAASLTKLTWLWLIVFEAWCLHGFIHRNENIHRNEKIDSAQHRYWIIKCALTILWRSWQLNSRTARLSGRPRCVRFTLRARNKVKTVYNYLICGQISMQLWAHFSPNNWIKIYLHQFIFMFVPGISY